MDDYQQWFSGQGPVFENSGFPLTPPDVSLCVGNGYIVQTLNLAIRVTDTRGKILAGGLHLNQFLGLFPGFYQYPPGSSQQLAGDFLSDPSCYFDKDTKQFFFSILWAPGSISALLNFGQVRFDNATGSHYGSGVILAVSGQDPTKVWDLFFIPGTNDGYSSHNDSLPPLNYPLPDSAGIIQDYPEMATDAYGLYVTTQQFTGVNGVLSYVGTNLYCVSKKALTLQPTSIAAVRFAMPFNYSADTSAVYGSVVPVKTPADGAYDLRKEGTMYFTSMTFENSTVGQGIALWTLTKTQLLNSNPLGLSLSLKIYKSPPYTFPMAAVPQKAGPIPIGKSLNSSHVEGLVDTNSLYYGDNGALFCSWTVGKVWATFAAAYGKDLATGAVVLSLDPYSSALASWVTFGVQGNHVIFPAVNLNKMGQGIVAFTLVGKDYYPSAMYATINSSGTIGSSMYIAAAGVEPLDNYDAYGVPGTPGAMRFGDWQTVVIDETGAAWAAVEYTSGNTMSPYNNWATTIFRVKPSGMSA